MGWLKKILNEGNELNITGRNLALFNYIEWGNMVDSQLDMEKLWDANIRSNIKHWDKHSENFYGRLIELPEHDQDCLIFVGASPILKRSVKYLKNLPSRFKIVAVNSAMGYLADHDIIPTYCILVDGAIGKWSFEWESVRKKCKDVIGIFGVAAYPEEIKKWPGKFLIIPYEYKTPGLARMIRRRYGGEYPMGGGNALNCAVALFLQFTKCTMYLFVANELSFKDSYYVNRGKAKSDGKPYIFTRNCYGKEVKSLFNLYEYKLWLENMAASFYGRVYFCDASEGVLGVDSDGTVMKEIDHKPLFQAINDIQEAFDLENLDGNQKNKIWYDQLYETGGYKPSLGKSYSEQLVKAINKDPSFKDNIKTVLDFGCGLGDAIKVFRDADLQAFGVDISNQQKSWDDYGIGEYCRTYDGTKLPYKDNEFDLVTSIEVMEHIPKEYTENILKEMFRVGRKYFAFTIALDYEANPVLGTIYVHITLKTAEEWIKLMEGIGYKIVLWESNTYHEILGHPIKTFCVFAQKGEPDDLRIGVEWYSKSYKEELAQESVQ